MVSKFKQALILKFQPTLCARALWCGPTGMDAQFHTSSALCRVVSAKYRITKKGDKPLTYEMANPPHFIAHRKSWNSWNTCKYMLVKSCIRREIFISNYILYEICIFFTLIIICVLQQAWRMDYVVQRQLLRMSLFADSWLELGMEWSAVR